MRPIFYIVIGLLFINTYAVSQESLYSWSDSLLFCESKKIVLDHLDPYNNAKDPLKINNVESLLDSLKQADRNHMIICLEFSIFDNNMTASDISILRSITMKNQIPFAYFSVEKSEPPAYITITIIQGHDNW